MTVLRDPERIEVDSIYIAPEHQGHGLGTQLMKRLIAEADATAKQLTLSTAKINPARRLYERLGFEVVNETDLKMYMRRKVSAEVLLWRKYDDMERRLTSSLSQRMLNLAGLVPAMRVLDVATGRGEPAIPAAHRVAPTGSVLGIDISDAMLQMARERASAEGVTNLELRTQSAESLSDISPVHFDAALARWGLMYFSSPVSAIGAIRRALVRGGILVAAMWAEPERVPYLNLPRKLLAQYASIPPIDFETPGTFRFAHVERIHRDFAAAGLTVAHIEEHDLPVMEAETDDDLVEWVRAFGMQRLLKDLSPKIQAAWEADLAREVRALSGDGKLRLGGITRIVVARNVS